MSAKLATIDVRLQNLELRGDPINELISKFAAMSALTTDVERRLLLIVDQDIDNRLRAVEAFVTQTISNRFTAQDMDLWIEQSRLRPSLDKLPDRPRR